MLTPRELYERAQARPRVTALIPPDEPYDIEAIGRLVGGRLPDGSGVGRVGATKEGVVIAVFSPNATWLKRAAKKLDVIDGSNLSTNP